MATKKKSKAEQREEPILILDDGVRYQGTVRAGRPHTEQHDEGTLVWPNGDKYTGQFKNGKRHGRGIRKNQDGSIFEGNYEED